MKRPTLETTINAATFAAFLCVLGLSWAIARDLPDRKAVDTQAQTEYRAELAAVGMCGEEGRTAVWTADNEIQCLKEIEP